MESPIKRKPGRPVGSKRKPPDPLDFLLDVMMGKRQADATQLRAAIAAAQYVHTKTHDGGKKEAKEGLAKEAAAGFQTVATPIRLVR